MKEKYAHHMNPIDVDVPTNRPRFSSLERKKLPEGSFSTDVPGGIRTPDRRLRRPLLYPAELLRQICTIKFGTISIILRFLFLAIVLLKINNASQ